MNWERALAGDLYTVKDGRFVAMVSLEGEIWRSRVYLDGSVISDSEWDGRDSAMMDASEAMARACQLRRYWPDAPKVTADERDDEGDCDD